MNYKPGPMPAQRPGLGAQMPRPPMQQVQPPPMQRPPTGQPMQPPMNYQPGPMPQQGNALMPRSQPMQQRYPNALAMWGRR